MTIRVGLQPIGARGHILMVTDGMGLTGGINIDPVMIAPMWGKPLEGKDAVADDVDMLGLHTSVKLGTLTVGGYGLYWNMNTYPINADNYVYGVTPSLKADFWWAGAYVEGKLGPVNIQLDAIYDYGEVQKRHDYIKARDVQYEGYVARLKVEYPWQKLSFGGVGVYGSGADLHHTGATGVPGEAPANLDHGGIASNSAHKVRSFVVPPGSEQAGGTGDDFFVFGNFVTLEAAPLNMAPSAAILGTGNVHRGSYGGLWFIKAFAGYKVAPWYKVTVEALYLGDTTKSGNTLGNAVRMDGRLRDDSDIGWEFNLINEINIYKNLKWDVGAGYLIAGDALDQMVANIPAGSPAFYNKSPHNPWIVATKLRYTF